jgi:ring-1,2-phenylacetyl-CoA epoxidase subunit PaaE
VAATSTTTAAATTTSTRRGFHPLSVAGVERLCDDAAAVAFAVPAELADTFAFRPGQSVVVARGGERRSYSVCAPAGRPLRIGVRAVEGGAVSGWLAREVAPGDVVEVAPPSGTFTPDLDTPGWHVAIAAGSGITPVLSIAGSLLERPATAVTVLYGNRGAGSVMFADELADLKDSHPTRLHLAHVLSREPQDVEAFSGRLDAERLRLLVPALCPPGQVDHWWLCGPYGLVTAATEVLAGFGVPAGRIHREVFYVEDQPPPPRTHADGPTGPGMEVTVVLDGRSSVATVGPDTPILDAAQRVRADLPFACKGGVCGTCRARVTGGEVRMRRNFALEDAEVAAGFVLTCQAVPVAGEIVVDYDA